ncbi:MAG TPA: prepilin-type N-terminal cleavage/methylation domain-containing protein [Nitrospirae bacterium]|nr:prepilin-type N-terminal cleavage/methylation domain-containing protein [Nitrospirota bacterium]
MKQQRHKRELKRTEQNGYSLVELLVVIVISLIITGAIYSSYISQQRSFTAQDQVTELNSTSRISLNILANDLRETGFGLLKKVTFNINGFTQVLTLTDNTNAPDRITLIGAFRKAGTLCSNGNGKAISPNDTNLILVPPEGSETLENINTTDKKNISIAGIRYGIVTSGGGANFKIKLQDPIDESFPMFTDSNGNGICDDGEGIPVYLIEDYTYQVVGTELQRVRRLNGVDPDVAVIAQNIEDLQFAMVNKNTVRINILASTARPDPNFRGLGNPPETIENRNLPATNDALRRRWWQMEVAVRNL